MAQFSKSDRYPRFEGKVGIVTGAAGSIGRCIAKALSLEGAKLCLADQGDLGPVADLVCAERVMAVTCDVSRPDQTRAMVSRTLEQFGGLDLLINVAGVVLNYASLGIGFQQHLGMELFKLMTKTEMKNVSYRGTAQAMTDVVAGVVDLMLTGPPSAKAMSEGG